jgi:hypothetical protein
VMQKSTTFTTIFRVKKRYFHYDFACKKCHFHYDMQKTLYCIRVLVAFYPLKDIKGSTIVSRLNILAWIKCYLKHLYNK